MELVGPAANAVLLVFVTVVLAWILRDRFDTVDKRFDAVDKRFDAQDARIESIAQDVASLKTLLASVQGRQDELSREVVALRSDIVQVALAVGARARPEPA